MAFVHTNDARLAFPRAGFSGCTERQNLYRLRLARKVEHAVEKALEYEGQKKMLEDFARSRTCTMPQICEERRLVTAKIHSLLLQWKPDFSVQWGLKVRRALPFLETAFSLMACCIADYAQPLLIEPRLKKVLCLIESIPSQSQASQSSAQQSLSSIFNTFQQQDRGIHFMSEHPALPPGKPHTLKAFLQAEEEEGMASKIEEGTEKSCLDIGFAEMMVHEGYDGAFSQAHVEKQDENRRGRREPSSICKFCMQGDINIQKSNSKTQTGSYCRPLTTHELHEEPFEWSKPNLPSRGTVATLMASELRFSRKEANQAVVNDITSSNDDQTLKENYNKQGEIAGQRFLHKTTDSQKRAMKKKKGDLCFKQVFDVLLHSATREKSSNGCVSFQKKRTTSKGIRSLLRIPCHMPPPAMRVLPFPMTCSWNPSEASDITTCCLLCLTWKWATEENRKIDVTKSGDTFPCSASVRDGGDRCQTDDVDVHPGYPDNHVGNDACPVMASSCCSLCESGKPSVASVCHHGIGVDPLASQECLPAEADPPHNSHVDGVLDYAHIQDNDVGLSSSTDIQKLHASVAEDEANKDPNNEPNVSGGRNSDIQDPSSENYATNKNINRREEKPVESSEECAGSCPISRNVSNEDRRQGDVPTNNQAGILDSDILGRGVLEPCAAASNSSGAFTSNLPSAQDSRRGSEEGQQIERRVRVSLSILLAEREDRTSRSPTGNRCSRRDCAWDTWEEPTEALEPLCCVCTIRLRGAAFTPCGHTFCRKCSRELWKARGTCPLCNKLITSILDIF